MSKVQYDSAKVRSVLVEVPIEGFPVAGNFSFNFPVVEVLKSATAILSIEAFNTTLVTKSPGQKNNASDAVYKVSFLTIGNSSNEEVRNNIPLPRLIRSNGSAEVKPLNIFGKPGLPNPVDPQRCKIAVADTSLLTAGTVFMLEITYLTA